MSTSILTVNGGSSSVKFALFVADSDGAADGNPNTLRRMLSGLIERIGFPNSALKLKNADGKTIDQRELQVADHGQAAAVLIEMLKQHGDFNKLAAIGHRIVHGGPKFLEHGPITSEMLAELHRIAPIDPEHLPGELALIDALSNQLPGTLQVACFDTAFHRDLPPVAKTLPIPQKYTAAGVRRFGFHGLSFAYLMKKLEEDANQSETGAKPRAAVGGGQSKLGKVILAHLGNGCSMAAVKDGKCIDTTMGFTPTAGLVMGTRCGDLDPGLLVYLLRSEKLTADQLDHLVNKESGLLGVSGKSSDMRDLLAASSTDRNSALAVDLFCYQARKWIGSLAASLDGLETLVFAGGIGENAPEIRSQICSALNHLGIQLDPQRNTAGTEIISGAESPVAVRVVRTDEELMIASIVENQLQLQNRDRRTGRK